MSDFKADNKIPKLENISDVFKLVPKVVKNEQVKRYVDIALVTYNSDAAEEVQCFPPGTIQ